MRIPSSAIDLRSSIFRFGAMDTEAMNKMDQHSNEELVSRFQVKLAELKSDEVDIPRTFGIVRSAIRLVTRKFIETPETFNKVLLKYFKYLLFLKARLNRDNNHGIYDAQFVNLTAVFGSIIGVPWIQNRYKFISDVMFCWLTATKYVPADVKLEALNTQNDAFKHLVTLAASSGDNEIQKHIFELILFCYAGGDFSIPNRELIGEYFKTVNFELIEGMLYRIDFEKCPKPKQELRRILNRFNEFVEVKVLSLAASEIQIGQYDLSSKDNGLWADFNAGSKTVSFAFDNKSVDDSLPRSKSVHALITQEMVRGVQVFTYSDSQDITLTFKLEKPLSVSERTLRSSVNDAVEVKMVLIYAEEKFPLLEQVLGDWYNVETVVAESVKSCTEDDDDECFAVPLEQRTPGIRKMSCVEESPYAREYANGFDTRNFPATLKTPQCKTNCGSEHYNVSEFSGEPNKDVQPKITADGAMIVDTADTIEIEHIASGRLPPGFANEMVFNGSGQLRSNESPERVTSEGGDGRYTRVAESQTIRNEATSANSSRCMDEPTEDLSNAIALHVSLRNRDKRNGNSVSDGDKSERIDQRKPQLDTNDSPTNAAILQCAYSCANGDQSEKATPNETNNRKETGSAGIALAKNVSAQGSEFVVHPTQVIALNDVQILSDDDMDLEEPLQLSPVNIRHSASQRNGTSPSGNRQQSPRNVNSSQRIPTKHSQPSESPNQRRNVHSTQVIRRADPISLQILAAAVIQNVDSGEENEIGGRDGHKTQDRVRTPIETPQHQINHSTQVVNRVESAATRIQNAHLTIVVRDSISISSQDAIADLCEKDEAVNGSRTPGTPEDDNNAPPPVTILADVHSTPDEIIEIIEKSDARSTSRCSTRTRGPHPPNADVIESFNSSVIHQERAKPRTIIVAQPKRTPLITSTPAKMTNSLPRQNVCFDNRDGSIYDKPTQAMPKKKPVMLPTEADDVINLIDDEDDGDDEEYVPPKPRRKAAVRAKENESPRLRSRVKASAPSKPRQIAASRAKSAPKKSKKTPSRHVRNFDFEMPKSKNRNKANEPPGPGPVSPCSDIASMESIGREAPRKRKLFSIELAQDELEDLDADADADSVQAPKRQRTKNFDEISETTVSSAAELDDSRKKNPEKFLDRVVENWNKLSQSEVFDSLKVDSKVNVAKNGCATYSYRASMRTTKSRVNSVGSNSTKKSSGDRQQTANNHAIDDGNMICSARSDGSVCSDDFGTF